jgi:hypothetical protein
MSEPNDGVFMIQLNKVGQTTRISLVLIRGNSHYQSS